MQFFRGDSPILNHHLKWGQLRSLYILQLETRSTTTVGSFGWWYTARHWIQMIGHPLHQLKLSCYPLDAFDHPSLPTIDTLAPFKTTASPGPTLVLSYCTPKTPQTWKINFSDASKNHMTGTIILIFVSTFYQGPKNVSLRNLSHPYQFKPRMFRWGPQHGPWCHSSNRQGSVSGDPRCWRYTRLVGLPIAYFTTGISQIYLLLLMVQKSQS